MQYGLIGNDEYDDIIDYQDFPEMMGGPFRNILKKIVARIRRRIADRIARRGGGGGNTRGDSENKSWDPYTVSLPSGNLTMSQSGVRWVKNPVTGKMSAVIDPGISKGIVDQFTQNPALLFGAVAIGVILFKKGKK